MKNSSCLLFVAALITMGGCTRDLPVQCGTGQDAVQGFEGELTCTCEMEMVAVHCRPDQECVPALVEGKTAGICQRRPEPDMGPPDQMPPPDAGADMGEGEAEAEGEDMGPTPECATSDDCELGLICTKGDCTSCTSDSQCPDELPTCDVALSPNRCVQCLDDEDCGTCTGDVCLTLPEFGVFGLCAEFIGMEVCDNADNDCDGATDEGSNPCGGVCALPVSPGTSCDGPDSDFCNDDVYVCNDFNDIICSTGADTLEFCNNFDDDCDGIADEGNPEGGTPCGSDIGECRQGSTVCSGGMLSCAGQLDPVVETCNGSDDDCDGAVDDGNPGGGASCGTDQGECRPGTLTCADGSFVCAGEVVPNFETCDGLDNDCDGLTDEGSNPCGGACALLMLGTSCDGSDADFCADDMFVCAGVNSVTCSDGSDNFELCDGLDNDCDGAVDEELGVGVSCDGSDLDLCNEGVMVCSITGTSVVCNDMTSSTAETCNGSDDDCDGAVDEGLGSTTCGMGVCEHTVSNCVGGAPNFCNPFEGSSAEVCDAVDNDCDGETDEGCTPPMEFCGDGSCNGSETCSTCAADCGICPPPPTCSCTDADSDGFFPVSCADPDCMPGGDCDETDPDVNPGAPESCNGMDDDCDGTMDGVTVETGLACGTDVGPCAIGTTVCFDGALDCVGDVEPTTEVCGDGVDQDCNGSDFACPPPPPTCSCMDADDDGFFPVSCTDPDCMPGGDCDDTLASVNPEATEVCGDGVDQDCNGSDFACPPPPPPMGSATVTIGGLAAGAELRDFRNNLCANGSSDCWNVEDQPGGTTSLTVTRPATGGLQYKLNGAIQLSDGSVVFLCGYSDCAAPPVANGTVGFTFNGTPVPCECSPSPENGSCVANWYCTTP